MHAVKEGDTLEAPCPTCCDWVAATYQARTLRLEDGKVMVPDILLGVCDVCGAQCAIPDSETHKIKAALSAAEEGRR